SCSPPDGLAPWESDDVGDPAFAGSAHVEAPDASPARLVVCAGGAGFSGKADSFHFVHQQVDGDFRITAQAPKLAVTNSKVALLARGGLDAGAPFAAIALESSGSQSINRFRTPIRAGAGATVKSSRGPVFDQPVGWMRLEREGAVLRTLSSVDGVEW